MHCKPRELSKPHKPRQHHQHHKPHLPNGTSPMKPS
eukprot:gene12166-biopygen18458